MVKRINIHFCEGFELNEALDILFIHKIFEKGAKKFSKLGIEIRANELELEYHGLEFLVDLLNEYCDSINLDKFTLCILDDIQNVYDENELYRMMYNSFKRINFERLELDVCLNQYNDQI